MELLKTPAKLEAALDELEGKGRKPPLYLDPETKLDRFTWGWSAVIVGCLVFLGFIFGHSAGSFASIIAVLLVLLAVLITTNEFSVVDFEKRCIKFQRTVLGFNSTLKTVPFDDLLTLAVSGHLHNEMTKKRRKHWWVYGVAALSKEGDSHAVFPELTRDFETACRTTERLARLLEQPMVKPLIESALEVEFEDGVPYYRYKGRLSSQLEEQVPFEALLETTSNSEDSASSSEHTKRARVSSPEDDFTVPSSAPARVPTSQTSDSYEEVEEYSRLPQSGCALFGLMLSAPIAKLALWALRESITKPDDFNITLIILFGLPAVWTTWYFGFWLISPITKIVTYIDRSRIATVDQVRSRGQHKVREVVIPHDAKIRVGESTNGPGSAGRIRLHWTLTIHSADGTCIFDHPPPKSREEAVKKAQQLADILDIEVEIDSEFT